MIGDTFRNLQPEEPFTRAASIAFGAMTWAQTATPFQIRRPADVVPEPREDVPNRVRYERYGVLGDPSTLAAAFKMAASPCCI
jgi:hypothetical protein